MGAALSKSGLHGRTPLATATLVVAANAPDVDVLSYLGGSYFALAFRRGITHGIPAHLLMPLVVAGGILAWDRWIRRRRRPDAPPVVPREILLLSFLGVLTHPILDWMNVYGMRWGLPFSGQWSYGDALFIIDPWLWLTLGSGVFLAGAGGRVLWGTLGALTTLLMWLGPVSIPATVVWTLGIAVVLALGWTGRPRQERGRVAWARGAVAASAIYIALMVAADTVGRSHVRTAAVALGLDVTDLMVSPAAANPFVADVEVRTSDGFVPGTYRWLPRSEVSLRPQEMVPFLRHPPELETTQVEAILTQARAHPDVRNYLVWARFPYAEVRRDGDAWVVRWSDARYDDRGDAGGLSGVSVRVPVG